MISYNRIIFQPHTASIRNSENADINLKPLTTRESTEVRADKAKMSTTTTQTLLLDIN